MRTGIIVFVVANVIMLTYIIGSNSKQPNVNPSQRIIDSLQAETYSQEIIINQYEMAIDQFRESYPIEAKKLDSCFKVE